MYTLKSIARRGTTLAAAVALMVGAIVPAFMAAPAFADNSLNPLTDRSLTLSSSSPGWEYVDGSNNPTYAPPNSGANGQKTGETFSFNTTTDSTTTNGLKAFTFQYCTSAAGTCTAPGDDATTSTTAQAGTGTISTTTTSTTVTGVGTKFTTELRVGDTISTSANGPYTIASIQSDTSLTLTADPTAAESAVTFTYSGTQRVDSATKSDLNVVTSSPSELSAATYAGLSTNSQTSTDPNNPSNTTTYTGAPDADNSQGNFVVLVNGTVNTGWAMTASNNEDGQTSGTTGKNNYITLTNSTGSIQTPPNTNIKVIFYGTNTNYITNPGSGAFFVKINDYNSNTTQDNTTLVDGGVTVANVMNQSIEITTKVLETMDFSVGTIDPDTLTDAQLATASGGSYTTHGTCNNILGSMSGPTGTDYNVLSLGNSNSENSLSTEHTYSTHSYWRLSSNSSAGATVYYSGNTLANTEGNTIAPMGSNTAAVAPQAGEAQFGLGLDNGTSANYDVNFATEGLTGQVYEQGADNNVAGIDPSFTTDIGSNPSANKNQLSPLVPTTAYGSAGGNNNTNYSANDSATATGVAPTAAYAFDANSMTVPVPIATESTTVVDCVTGKMRYVANIAATTPAGIYTTKINYIAAPQY